MAHAPLDRAVARPTDAPPLAHEAGVDAAVPDVEPPAAEAPLLPPEELPRHVAIIMDGNRRWARARGLADFEGHAAGVEAIRGLLQHAVRRGVPMLTLYAFSRENWARSDDEVSGLFDLLGQAIRERDRRAPRAGRPRPAPRPPRGAPGRDPRRRSATRSTRPRRAPASSSTSPGTTRAGPRSSTRSVGCSPSGVTARGGRRAGHQRGAVHHGPARPRPRDPDRRRVPHQQLPDLAVRLRRARVRRVPVAGLRPRVVRHRAARVRPSHPPVRPVGPAPMLRTRALSAVVIVLPLLIALAIGTPALAVFLAIVAALGAWEAFRLLRMAGYPSLPRVRHRARGRDGARGGVAARRRQGDAARRRGRRAGRDRRVRADRQPGRPDRVDGDRVRRRLRGAPLVRPPGGRQRAGHPRGLGVRAARGGARLGPAAHLRGLELRHRRVPRRAARSDATSS